MNNQVKTNNILMCNKNIKPRAPLKRKRKKMKKKRKKGKDGKRGEGKRKERRERVREEEREEKYGCSIDSSFSTCVFRSLHSNKLRNRTASSLSVQYSVKHWRFGKP